MARKVHNEMVGAMLAMGNARNAAHSVTSRDGVATYRLHYSDIATWDGTTLKLDNHGYSTVTTNAALKAIAWGLVGKAATLDRDGRATLTRGEPAPTSGNAPTLAPPEPSGLAPVIGGR